MTIYLYRYLYVFFLYFPTLSFSYFVFGRFHPHFSPFTEFRNKATYGWVELVIIITVFEIGNWTVWAFVMNNSTNEIDFQCYYFQNKIYETRMELRMSHKSILDKNEHLQFEKRQNSSRLWSLFHAIWIIKKSVIILVLFLFERVWSPGMSRKI